MIQANSVENVRTQIRAIISACAKVDEDSITPDLDLIDSGILDSLGALQIINQLERKFGVLIPEEDLGGYVSLNAITEGISALREEV